MPIPSHWGQEPSLTLKLKRPGLIAPGLAFGKLAEEIADFIEEFDVGRRIGPGIASDRGLVDGDHFVDIVRCLLISLCAPTGVLRHEDDCKAG